MTFLKQPMSRKQKREDSKQFQAAYDKLSAFSATDSGKSDSEIKAAMAEFEDVAKPKMGVNFDPEMKARNMRLLSEMNENAVYRCMCKCPEAAQDQLMDMVQAWSGKEVTCLDDINPEIHTGKTVEFITERLAELVDIDSVRDKGQIISNQSSVVPWVKIPTAHKKILMHYGIDAETYREANSALSMLES